MSEVDNRWPLREDDNVKVHLPDSTAALLKERAGADGCSIDEWVNQVVHAHLQQQETALDEFAAFIEPRMERARRGEFSESSLEAVVETTLRELEHEAVSVND